MYGLNVGVGMYVCIGRSCGMYVCIECSALGSKLQGVQLRLWWARYVVYALCGFSTAA